MLNKSRVGAEATEKTTMQIAKHISTERYFITLLVDEDKMV